MNNLVKRHKGPAPRPANDNSNLRDRLCAARIGWREGISGALGWGSAMAISAQASLWISVAALTSHYWTLTALVFVGAACAWPLSLVLFRLIAFRRPRGAAFATAFLCLTIVTIGVTSAMFAVIYRQFYAQWHGDPFTKLWLVQLAFTVASALYQFAVQGIRLYLPLGVIFLGLTSYWLARRHSCPNQSNSGIISQT